ncbi:NAD-glutamate dehydrogenase [Saxibacter everestensis]|uniref:NAD-glutamate dehydrogenase n=1 Tax=Saxibacter everestensis TaxID=2909229 RepID=A0ABY8QP01_9MICO|nr:NAD-glutamate dehydrogenase [Brevibacteriaceae bacterium ZFBP1038]
MSTDARMAFDEDVDWAGVQRRWEEIAGSAPPRDFLATYFAHVADEDALTLGTDALAGLAHAHWQLAQGRPAGRAVINVHNPEPDAHGYTSSRTVVDIVTDDMSFLVGSVSAELTRQKHGIQLVIHPIVVVRRDVARNVEQVLDLPSENAGLPVASGDTATLDVLPNLEGATVESWIHIEIDKVVDPGQLEAIEDGIRDVLAEVRASGDEFDRMRAKALDIAGELEERAPTPGLEEEAAVAARLLRWMADENFTFVGYREYDLEVENGDDVLIAAPGSDLGVLRSHRQSNRPGGVLTRNVQAKAREKRVLVLTKANSRSRVNRRSYLDYVGIKTYNAAGEVIGERRFLGLFSSTAYTHSVLKVPVIGEKVREIIHRSGYSRNSHSGKDLLAILETYPRDELFQADIDELYQTAIAVVHLQERRRPRVFLRRDSYERFMSVLVYLPRDQYNTDARLRIEAHLREVFDAESVDYDAWLSESVLARLHFVVRVARGKTLAEVDQTSLQQRVIEALRGWSDDLMELLVPTGPDGTGSEAEAQIAARWAHAFPEAYKEDFSPSQALEDIKHLEAAEHHDQLQMRLYTPAGDSCRQRFAFYRAESLSLTTVLPFLANLGVEVVDERPYELSLPDGQKRYIYDFGLRYDSETKFAGSDSRFVEAFAAAWQGLSESDGLEQLVLAAGLGWREIVIVRTYARYLRQVGLNFSETMLARVIVDNAPITRKLTEFFAARFDPAGPEDMSERHAEEARLVEELKGMLDDVKSLDADRILRTFMELMQATLRTNFYQRDEAGKHKAHVTLKLDPSSINVLPKPRPALEMWVYSPRVEGVHLRFGRVARGGLRWSDRREDFRTEVLGLVKAQTVKNALIVPTGAKGGFFCKSLPDSSNREAWLAEGTECYQTFIRGMLDVTDNLVYAGENREVVAPRDVVRHDGEDTYLVVAADKGTASFSDTANAVAQSYGFWLGDAFASGGSVGYDHKAMGITARGAWESVKRHFRELGRDIQTEDFTAVGVGDMSGDVFGNGMLLSTHTRLVAAFDHRHIFLDPNPDSAASHVERQRLFKLPRSSWADYDVTLISEGGGVFPRTAKSVPITDQVRDRLGLESDVRALAPEDLLRAILRAPVDLVYNGGIGTYIKASTESNADVGDKANDAIRVNGDEVRALVIGEGGNLGVTQLGRIEAALHDVRVNTDAIDNSAGVDCSDHEVNIKIFLDRLVAAGDISPDDRDGFLLSMTDDVANLVLAHNYRQNMVLGDARVQTVPMSSVYLRMMKSFEQRGDLDRKLEFLPTTNEVNRRNEGGKGFTSPELSVLLAYGKMALSADLLASELPDEVWAQSQLKGYFPAPLVDRYADRLGQHPLRREVVTTMLVNDLVDRGGLTFAFRVMEETGADAAQTMRVFMVAKQVFGLDDYIKALEATDGTVDTGTQIEMQLEYRRLLDRATRWLVHQRPSKVDVDAEVSRYRSIIGELLPHTPELVRGTEKSVMGERAESLIERNVPRELAWRTAALLDQFVMLDIAELIDASGEDPREVASLYYTISDRFNAASMLGRIGSLPRGDRWNALARGALRDDFYAAIESVVAAVLEGTDSGQPAEDRLAAWEEANASQLSRAMETVDEVRQSDHGDLASLSVALRLLRTVVRTSQSSVAPATGMVPVIETSGG